MHQRTIATLDRLEQAVWFSRVGMRDIESAIVLPSWHDAIEHCSSLEWQNICLEADNQYCVRLLKRSIERYREWNEIVIKLKQVVIPFVNNKIESVVRENNLPKAFENTVQWDILGVCIEAEYADVCPPGWSAGQAYWYTKGHFPCGWQGGFPNGMPIIY
jgi:hypothetical protein